VPRSTKRDEIERDLIPSELGFSYGRNSDAVVWRTNLLFRIKGEIRKWEFRAKHVVGILHSYLWFFDTLRGPDVFEGSDSARAKIATPFGNLLRTLNSEMSETRLKNEVTLTRTKIACLGWMSASILGYARFHNFCILPWISASWQIQGFGRVPAQSWRS